MHQSPVADAVSIYGQLGTQVQVPSNQCHLTFGGLEQMRLGNMGIGPHARQTVQ